VERLVALRGAPESIPTDKGGEFAGQMMDAWAHRRGVKLDSIRPGRPGQNGYIESFNRRLRDECLNTEVFLSLAEAREKDRKLAVRRQPAPATQFAGRRHGGRIRPGSRPFALPMVDKAARPGCQGFAGAGRKVPALDTPPRCLPD
jgi:transposase InsO family protein